MDSGNVSADMRLNLYKRLDIQKEMVRQGKGKEVAVRYGPGGYGKRPDVLTNEADVFELAKQGVTSFHVSEETWEDPLDIVTGMSRKAADALRTGWDLVLDIDCAFIEYSKIACDLLVQALQYHGVKSVSVKFSGNKGFHIGVPFEAMPRKIQGEDTAKLFPEAPRRIALYLTDFVKDRLAEKILELEGGDFGRIVSKVELPAAEITRTEKDQFGMPVNKLHVEPFLEVDTILIASRHLYRGTYSFNEKSGLVSIPVPLDKIMAFEKPMAAPENVKVDLLFMDRSTAQEDECTRLFREAYDHKPKVIIEETGPKKDLNYDELTEAIPEELFPPCMKLVLSGKLKDGRKRAMFALLNFLQSVGWTHEQIVERVRKWNADLEEPLREVIIEGQLRYRKENKDGKLPPNCNNRAYYIDLGICKPDGICRKIKNPVNYARRRAFAAQRDAEKGKKEKKPKLQKQEKDSSETPSEGPKTEETAQNPQNVPTNRV